MLFNSIEFILFFLIVTPLYYLLPHKFRWFHLLVASCIFYMAFVPIYIVILFGTIIIDYFAGILIERSERHRRLFLIMSLIANCGVLIVFKYYNFFIDNINFVSGSSLPLLKILLPIGLSFHTFQAMSYTIEVYRRNQKAERNFGIYALYVMFYPQLVAGPIERPQNILHQFYERHRFDVGNLGAGFRLIIWGMFKKVVIADRLAVFVNQVYENSNDYTGIPLWVAAVFFSFQIYFDFSGYSSIALGCARVMGFNLMPNFNRPYQATSFKMFWSRWHMSLSTWFRDYVYIPLGGNKAGLKRWMFNILVVFMLSGLWHGANWTFIVWGALHGIFQIFEIFIEKRKLLSVHPFFKRIVIFLLVTIAWIYFRAEHIEKANYIVSNLFTGIPAQLKGIIENQHFERLDLLYLGQEKFQFYFSILLLLLVGLIHYLQKQKPIDEYFSSLKYYYRWPLYFMLLYSTVFLGVFGKYQFIYFQF